MSRDNEWINTFTGKRMHPLDPSADDICIEDIAHALSLQCRFTGHLRRFYSVAEHSVRVATRVPPDDALWGLLHDASEAYLVDVARPVKHTPAMAAYRDAEARLMRVICERFGLDVEQPASVTEADNRMLITEAQQLLTMHPDWALTRAVAYQPYDMRMMGMPPHEAEQIFLQMFRGLAE